MSLSSGSTIVQSAGMMPRLSQLVTTWVERLYFCAYRLIVSHSVVSTTKPFWTEIFRLSSCCRSAPANSFVKSIFCCIIVVRFEGFSIPTCYLVLKGGFIKIEIVSSWNNSKTISSSSCHPIKGLRQLGDVWLKCLKALNPANLGLFRVLLCMNCAIFFTKKSIFTLLENHKAD